MTSSPAGSNGNDFDLKRAANEELKARDGIVDYEITESSTKYILVKVAEKTEDGGSRGVSP